MFVLGITPTVQLQAALLKAGDSALCRSTWSTRTAMATL